MMGSELPSSMEEEREYLRCRWGGIHGLGLKHSYKAAELLEVFPSRSSPVSLPFDLLFHPLFPECLVNVCRKSGDGRIKPKKPVDRRFLGTFTYFVREEKLMLDGWML